MPSRRINDLNPNVYDVAMDILAAWRMAKLDVLVTCTMRSRAEQEEIWASGRSRPGKILTYSEPGTSKHELGLAMDFVPLLMGKPVWDAKSGLWKKAAECAKAVHPCVRWGGDWRNFKDLPHLEFVLGDLRDAAAGNSNDQKRYRHMGNPALLRRSSVGGTSTGT